MTDEHDRRFPLAWPSGWPRSPSRRMSSFKSRGFGEARDALLRELRLLGAVDVVLSTNLELRLDGLPRAAQRQPADRGVAVYFRRGTIDRMKPYALACDKWSAVEDNAYALAKHVEALRGQERWGVGTVEQAFAGYAQLPPKRTGRWASWEDCFGIDGTPGNMTPDQKLDHVDRRHRERLREMRATHPAGDHPDEAELHMRRDEAISAISLAMASRAHHGSR